MTGVFVSYRRSFHDSGHDSQPSLVEALADRLRHHFGDAEVFLDIESIPAGDRFERQLRDRLVAAEVLIAVIGAGWLTELRHRQRQPERDWLRWEIGEALRVGVAVVPVLLGDTPLPPADELPDDVADLAARQARQIRPGSFRADVDRLIKALEARVAPVWVPPDPSPPPPRPAWRTVAAAIAPPAVLGGLLATVSNPRLPPAVGLAEIASVPSLFILLGAVVFGVLYRQRRAIDRVERATAESHPVVFFLLGALPVALAGAVASIPFAERNEMVAALTPILLMVLLSVTGALTILSYQEERRWPPDFVLHGVGGEARLRRAVARYRERSLAWRVPLSRLQRDQTRWFRDRLRLAVGELRARADRDRLEALRQSGAAAVAFVSLALNFAVLPLSLIGVALARDGAGQAAALLGTVPALVMLAVLGLTGEFAYRLERWRQATIAAEVAAYVVELDNLLGPTIATSGPGAPRVPT